MSDQLAQQGKDWTVPIVGTLAAVVIAGFLAFIFLGPKLRDRATIKGAQEAAASQLRDPSSAQFRNVRVNGIFVCGEVNGKNGFGAYNGFVRFYGTKDSADIDPGEGGPTFYGEPIMKTSFERSYKGYCES